MIPNSFLIDGLKPTKVTGVPVVYADRPGRNRNVYSKQTLKEGIDYYTRLASLDPTYKYAFAKHPKNEDEEWMGLIAGTVDALYFDDAENTVKADFTLLPTIWGHFIDWLIKNEHHVGTSIRGGAKGKRGKAEIAGKNIDVTHRSDLRLEGVDFVIYPSFVTTHMNKGRILEKTQEQEEGFESVLESFVKDASDRTGLGIDAIRGMLNHDNVKGDSTMDELMLRKEQAQLQIERAELETKKLEDQRASLTNEISTLSQDHSTLQASVQELRTVSEAHHRINTALSVEIEEKKKSIAELDAKLSDLKASIDQMQTEYTKLREQTEKAASELVVKFAGMTFDKETPPKLRVVPVEEQVADTEWGKVKKDVVRQLLSLAGDADMASQVCGIVGDIADWNTLTYPVYQPVKSTTEGFDIDLVLNPKGVATAAAFMSGKPGQALTDEERKALSEFISAKYEMLEEAGMEKMPESMKTMEDNMEVAEKVKLEDGNPFADAFNQAIITGYLKVPAEKIRESFKITNDMFKKFLTSTVEASIPAEEKEEANVGEAVENSADEKPSEMTEEMKMELLGKIKALLESRLDGVAIAKDEDVLEVVATLIDDYAKVYADYETLELANAKASKTSELRENGVAESVIKDEMDKVETIEELEAMTERVIRLTKSIKESATRENRRSVIPPPVVEKEEKKETPTEFSNFDRLMRSI